ncbi:MULTISPECIES: hypothetical protein [Vibrio]|uniref:DNA-binding protein H-NS-like N-terminal domain-containing protein n=2 Tax=Vibrio TaxID=662 RepID=A0A1E5CW74_9VIBR|nr:MULTISPECIES: hypothetical protein [Vibrio]RBW65695.1 hypothetical protein DS893_08140 [Vibrionales bacterium C3R12]MDN3699687.1 hypothetical protein [Vibrio cortegadensis]NOH85877.1 hypothetical protein [Vibrio sp. 03-59-1]OEE74444.1 hypothetical protein A130_06345 [Vibrio genomosp. F6 str. FF-238]TKF24528.1 hypothetical protein FCV43_00540 [Vibrio genomosp. F6]
MSLTTYEMARVLEQMEESPEKVMFGKLLSELGNQSEERIRSAAKQVPLHTLRDIIYQFQQVAESRKGEQVGLLAKELAEQGISADELKDFIEQSKRK